MYTIWSRFQALLTEYRSHISLSLSPQKPNPHRAGTPQHNGARVVGSVALHGGRLRKGSVETAKRSWSWTSRLQWWKMPSPNPPDPPNIPAWGYLISRQCQQSVVYGSLVSKVDEWPVTAYVTSQDCTEEIFTTFSGLRRQTDDTPIELRDLPWLACNMSLSRQKTIDSHSQDGGMGDCVGYRQGCLKCFAYYRIRWGVNGVTTRKK